MPALSSSLRAPVGAWPLHRFGDSAGLEAAGLIALANKGYTEMAAPARRASTP